MREKNHTKTKFVAANMPKPPPGPNVSMSQPAVSGPRNRENPPWTSVNAAACMMWVGGTIWAT